MTRRTSDLPTLSATADGATGKPSPSRVRRVVGDNERAVKRSIRQFPAERIAERPDLVALAATLARSLDLGMGLATAGVSKELRATMAELQGVVDDVGGDEVSAWLRSITEMGYSPTA